MDLTDDALTGDFRVLQRRRGHRFSVDDVTTAWVAARANPKAETLVDLGCGIGSVLLMMAWKFPEATLVGVEAQEISFGLAQQNVSRNQVENRVSLRFGDFREKETICDLSPAELITCTPPYVPVGKGTPSPDSQRAHARQEMRGGVEAYLTAASSLLTTGGTVVTCADARTPERVTETAKRLSLFIQEKREVIPRAERDPLFTIWRLTNEPVSRPIIESPITIRHADGSRTELAHEIRAFFGLPPNSSETSGPK